MIVARSPGATARAASRNSRADAPLRHHPRVAALGARRRSDSTDGLCASAGPSIRMTASIAGSWWRTACTFSSCSSVETTAMRAPESLQDVARLRRRQRRIDRHRDAAGGDHGEVGQDPFRPALGHDRDAIARRHAERRQPEREVADALEQLLARDALHLPGTHAAHGHRLLESPEHMERQVGDGANGNLGLGGEGSGSVTRGL